MKKSLNVEFVDLQNALQLAADQMTLVVLPLQEVIKNLPESFFFPPKFSELISNIKVNLPTFSLPEGSHILTSAGAPSNYSSNFDFFPEQRTIYFRDNDILCYVQDDE